MQLSLRDVARLLRVPEESVYRWVDKEELPAMRVNDRYYFNKSELLEWAALRRIDVSPEIFGTVPVGNGVLPTITAALEAGGIYYDVGGPSRDLALREVVGCLPLPSDYDRETLLDLLIAREQHASTGIGEGIAIPHPRTPIVTPADEPRLALCFLRESVSFGARDGLPVQIVFLLMAPNVRTHLHLLARLACLLRDSDFRSVVLKKGAPAEILAAARRSEAAVISS